MKSEAFFGFKKGLREDELRFEKEEEVTEKDKEKKEDNFKKERLHKGIIYCQLTACRSRMNDVYLYLR